MMQILIVYPDGLEITMHKDASEPISKWKHIHDNGVHWEIVAYHP